MKARDIQSALSPAEYSVLRELVLRGATSAEIAKTLSLSTFTVSNHLRSIYTALGVHSRTAIMATILIPNLPPKFVAELDVVLPPSNATEKERKAGAKPAHTLSRAKSGSTRTVTKRKKTTKKRPSARKKSA